MVKCIIVDDEPIARRVIKNHLALVPEFSMEAECTNAIEAMSVLSKQKIDLMFCDIQMPQITGVEFIRSLIHSPAVIFITAYRDFAVDAFELNVIDYLVKPVSFERFAKSLNKYLDLFVSKAENPTNEKKEEAEYIFLKADKKHHKVKLEEILWLESLGDYVNVLSDSGKITCKERISTFEEMLPSERFIRIHRSFIVSVQQITSIGAGFVEIGKKKLPIGRLYKNEVHRLIDLNNRK